MEPSLDTPIHGYCDARFGAVKAAFAANFAAGRETGASFAATVDGRFVVDIWGGFADEACTKPWARDTIVNVYSTTKVATAICASMLIDRGLLDPAAPVAKYWPEFAQAGKERVTVAQLLSHQAGVPAVTGPPVDLCDWDAVCRALAAERPWWEPGTANGYHAFIFGHLVGELVRRTTGKSLGAFVHEEVAGPLGADFLIGFGPEEDARCGETFPAPRRSGGGSAPESLMSKVILNPAFTSGMVGTRAWRAAEVPAANGHSNARGCARIMSALACGGALDGVRLMSATTLDRAITEQCYRPDLVLGTPVRWGFGFMLASAETPFGPSARAFGHGGAGGSIAIADPDARASWSYAMNRMGGGTVGDKRSRALSAAFYSCL